MADPIIVCVDDDQSILDVITRCLRRLPYDLRTTLSANQALAWLEQDPVSVLVSDYEMPEMTGAQLAGRAKRVRPETTRILLTGMRTFETVVDGINQGEIFRFISKPFEPQVLRDAIVEAIARNQELLALSGDKQRRERREALRTALEHEYPGISAVETDRDGRYQIDTAILALAQRLGYER